MIKHVVLAVPFAILAACALPPSTPMVSNVAQPRVVETSEVYTGSRIPRKEPARPLAEITRQEFDEFRQTQRAAKGEPGP